jgi:serine/threonine protein kinase
MSDDFELNKERDILEDSSKWSRRRGLAPKDIGALTFINEDESNNNEGSIGGIGLRDRRVRQLQMENDLSSSNLKNLSIGLQQGSSSSSGLSSIRGVRIREVESAHHGLDEDLASGLNSTLNASTNLGSFRISASGTLRLGNFMAINGAGIKRFGRQSKPSPISGSLPSFISESRAKDIKHELVMLDVLGRGASGVVQRALHLPSLQLVAVKHVRMFDADVRNQAVRELKSLYANMVPLAAFRRHKSSLQSVSREKSRDGGGDSFLGDTLIFGGSFGSSIGTSSVATPVDLGATGTFSPTLDSQLIAQDVDSHDSTAASYSAHLIRLYDAYIDPRASTVSIVIEYCGGGSLQDIVDAGGCRDERVLARMAAHSLRGLAYLHAHRQLHRDIKPGNILCSTNGDSYKLADFGIVRQLGEGTQDQYAKTWVGTMVYMSPERMSSSSGSGYSFPSDIWSLGLSIFSVALGRYPYQDIAYWELLSSIKDFPPPLHQLDEVYANSYIMSNESGGGVHSIDEAAGDSHHILPSPSKEFIDFLEQTLCRDPERRPSAEKLLQHAFIVSNIQSTKRGSTSTETSGWIGVPPVEEVSFSKDSVIGIPLSESAESGPHCAKRPGAFSKLPVEQQESLVDGLKALIYEVVADRGGLTHWSSFMALFGSSGQSNNGVSHTLRNSLKLDEFSFNEYLLKRIGADDNIGPNSPSKPTSTFFSVPEGSEISVTAAKGNFQLGIDDVRILSKQLGLPPLIVCAAFNDVISLKMRGLPIEQPKSLHKKVDEDDDETDPILELLDADIAQSSGLGETFSTKFGGKQSAGPSLEVVNLGSEVDDDEDEDDALDGIFFRPQGRTTVGGGGGSTTATTIFFKEGAHSVVIREVPSTTTSSR